MFLFENNKHNFLIEYENKNENENNKSFNGKLNYIYKKNNTIIQFLLFYKNSNI